MNLEKLPARNAHGAVHVVVESPRGSTLKLKYDPTLELFTVSRPLVLGLRYPHDWGFVPGTLAPDGDPLDALVLHDDTTYPGVLLACRPLGVLQVSQKSKEHPDRRERNDRLLVVPVTSPRGDELRSLDDVPARVRRELEHFFAAAVALQDKELRLEGWADAAAASALVDQTTLGASPGTALFAGAALVWTVRGADAAPRAPGLSRRVALVLTMRGAMPPLAHRAAGDIGAVPAPMSP
ncbi:MAG: inorganic diphosphatase, partial [Myxococcales bacterium]